MNRKLDEAVVGVDWNFSQYIRDNVMETLSGVKGENSIKIFGPDLDELEKIAGQAVGRLNQVRGIRNVGVFSIKGQTNLELAIDREKCALWNVSIADVQDALQTAVGGQAFTQMVEGERTFDITLRWPERLRVSEDLILDIPVDVVKNRVVADTSSDGSAAKGSMQLSGTSLAPPSVAGTKYQTEGTPVPRRRLRDLVTPVNEKGFRDPGGKFTRSGASTIYREQDQRFIAVKFSVRERDLAGAVAEAKAKTKDLFKAPYRAEWSGEFQEMEEAVARLGIVASLALVLIVVLLYLALLSLLDVATVMANVIVICIGGIWSLILTGSNFNISAGVGFISILGVGIMNGLLMVSAFNAMRAHGEPLRESIMKGTEKLIRPLTMTALAAIFGMLPAALATGMGSQTQKPLAIVVVGGMTMTLLLLNIVPVLYSFYGQREPRADVAGMGH
jgi:cobalt-zinc-cadmium resistance protein CzcA